MLFGFPIALDLLGERPFGNFDLAIKYGRLAKSLLDDCFGRDAGSITCTQRSATRISASDVVTLV